MSDILNGKIRRLPPWDRVQAMVKACSDRASQNNPDYRQTIVDVISAYLRMPYAFTPEQSEASAHFEERQVRLTAQRILSAHLRSPEDEFGLSSPGQTRLNPFWENMRVDFSGATLIDLDFSRTVITIADFTSVTFSGDADFRHAAFDSASFRDATFAGHAHFSGSIFALGEHGRKIFDPRRFYLSGGVAILTLADFGSTSFIDEAQLHETRFALDAFEGIASSDHDDIYFHGGEGVQVASSLDADSVLANARSSLSAVISSDTKRLILADFRNTTFTAKADFSWATFLGDELLGFTSIVVADFSGADFGGGTCFQGASFKGRFLEDTRRDFVHVRVVPPVGWAIDFKENEQSRFGFESHVGSMQAVDVTGASHMNE